MSQYGRPQYWEQRYTKFQHLIRDPQQFDWYQRFSGIKEYIIPLINPEFKILNIGAGNSRLSQEMFDEGFQNITNIDISLTVTKAMVEKYKQKGTNFKYLQMDVRALQFPEGSFDCVIDKATLDSILCGQGSNANGNKMLSQIHRVLSQKGVYIIISYGVPEYRLNYLQKFDWSVKIQQVPKPSISASITLPSDQSNPNVHYLYICQKGAKQ